MSEFADYPIEQPHELLAHLLIPEHYENVLPLHLLRLRVLNTYSEHHRGFRRAHQSFVVFIDDT